MTQNTPNDKKVYKVTSSDLPLHCPMPNMRLWDSHPKVFIPVSDSPNGKARCPYCGAEYVLEDKQAA